MPYDIISPSRVRIALFHTAGCDARYSQLCWPSQPAVSANGASCVRKAVRKPSCKLCRLFHSSLQMIETSCKPIIYNQIFGLFLKKKKNLVEAFKRIKQRNTKKSATNKLFIALCGGKGGIRTPGASQHGGFQDRCNRPLYHLSKLLWRRTSFQKRCKGTATF